jgi:hypothetical protein
MHLIKSMTVLLFSVSAACGATRVQASPATSLFTCAEGISFTVEYRSGGQIAAVRTPVGNFLLSRKASSLGQRFVSSQATLIVDGDFAAFVTENANDFTQCKVAAANHPLGSAPGSGERP